MESENSTRVSFCSLYYLRRNTDSKVSRKQLGDLAINNLVTNLYCNIEPDENRAR
jgi:hypothetical protein